MQTTVEVTQNGAYAYVGIAFLANTTGAVYVDDVQFEKSISGGAGSFNQLADPSFERTLSDNWGGSGGFYASAVGNDAPASLTNMATVAGDPSSYKNLRQILYLKGKKDDSFIVGAWAKANSVPTDGDYTNKKGKPEFGISVTFFSDGTQVGEAKEISFNSGIDEWQFLSDEIIAPADYSMIYVTLVYGFNTGVASFSCPFLYKESYGQSYVYDENGNVVSSKDKAETEATFAYQDDTLTSSLSPTGSRYMYANDDTTYNTRYAVSDSGQKITFGYNGSGDATEMYINDLEFITALPHKTVGENETVPPLNCYLVNAKNGRVLEPHELSAGKYVYAKNFDYASAEMWQLQFLSGSVYSIRCLSNTALGLTTLSSGDGYQIGTVTVNSDWVPNVPFKFAITPNGDGTFKISTAKRKGFNGIRTGKNRRGKSNRYNTVWRIYLI